MTPGPAKQFDREQALSEAMHLFWAKGYDAVGVSELLDTMGIGRQSMYDTFGSKRELFLSALRQYVSGQVAAVQGLLQASDRPMEDIDAAFDYWKQLVRLGRGCFAGNSFSELGPRDPEVAQVLQRGMQGVAGAFQETLQRAVDRGDLQPDTDVAGLADLIVTTGQGVALLSQLPSGAELGNSAWGQLEAMIDRCRKAPPREAGGRATTMPDDPPASPGDDASAQEAHE